MGDGEEYVDVPKMLVEAAARLALDINADAILALTETGENCTPLVRKKFVSRHGKNIKVIVATSSLGTCKKLGKNANVELIKLTARPSGRVTQARHAMACGLREGILSPGQRLVCLAGDGFADITDSLMVLDVTEDQRAMGMLESNPVLASAVELSLELGKGGPDAKPVGTAFVIGESKAVMRMSHQLMINPFKGYRANLTDSKYWDLLKKYAVLDGAFVVEKDGLIVAAHRCLNANVRVEIPKGLGTRHLAVASMTAVTRARGVTISSEDGAVRIFEGGKLVAKADPGSKIIECLHGFP